METQDRTRNATLGLLGLILIVSLVLVFWLLGSPRTWAQERINLSTDAMYAKDPLHVAYPTQAITLTRGPYLQSVTTNSVLVVWETDVLASSRVDYGPTAAYGLIVSSTVPVTHHVITLAGLTPHAFYHYQISSDGQVWGPDNTFRAGASSAQTTFSFVAFGDTRSNHAAHQAVVDRIVSLVPEFVLHTGDMVTDGSLPTEWDTFFNIEQNLLRQASFFGALGNHERNSVNYFDAFHLPGNERWYSFDYGNAHIVVLQVDGYVSFAPGSAQYTWLEDDLASTTQFWKLVFFHAPPHSSGNHGGITSVRNYLCPLFVKYHVDVVFNGHDHDYERSIADGVTYIVTGGGGAPLHGQVNPNPYSVYFTSTYHCISVTVAGEWLSGVAIRPDGVSFDPFTLHKGPTATTTSEPFAHAELTGALLVFVAGLVLGALGSGWLWRRLRRSVVPNAEQTSSSGR